MLKKINHTPAGIWGLLTLLGLLIMGCSSKKTFYESYIDKYAKDYRMKYMYNHGSTFLGKDSIRKQIESSYISCFSDEGLLELYIDSYREVTDYYPPDEPIRYHLYDLTPLIWFENDSTIIDMKFHKFRETPELFIQKNKHGCDGIYFYYVSSGLRMSLVNVYIPILSFRDKRIYGKAGFRNKTLRRFLKRYKSALTKDDTRFIKRIFRRGNYRVFDETAYPYL